MRVGLDITQGVKRKVRGIARYIREILPHLLARGGAPDSIDPVLYVRGERIFRRGLLSGLSEGMETHWMPLGAYLPGRRLNLFHSFGNHLPARSHVPLTFTAHDFRVLDMGDGSPGRRLRRNIARSAGILCLTQDGRSRLLHHFPVYDPERVAVVPHGVDHQRFRPMQDEAARAAASRRGLRPPYLLQLGSWFPHKNLDLSIEAFARSRARKEGLRLAFVGGGASAEHRHHLVDMANASGVEDAVDWLEDVPANDIPAVLAAATCLLQPSRYEGFALPLLEAMAVGTPGVICDSSCLPEVTGGAWPIAKQDDADEFAAFFDALVFDSEKRAATVAAGLQRAAAFTWEGSAEKTVAFFQRIAELERL